MEELFDVGAQGKRESKQCDTLKAMCTLLWMSQCLFGIWGFGRWILCVWAFENEKVLIVCIQHLVCVCLCVCEREFLSL